MRPQSQNASGKLRGVIVDWQYARILGSCVDLTNKTFKTRVRVDTNGEFEIDLPAGQYQATGQSPGFQRFRWNHLKIEAGATKTLNILLNVSNKKRGCPEGTIPSGPMCTNICDVKLGG